LFERQRQRRGVGSPAKKSTSVNIGSPSAKNRAPDFGSGWFKNQDPTVFARFSFNEVLEERFHAISRTVFFGLQRLLWAEQAVTNALIE